MEKPFNDQGAPSFTNPSLPEGQEPAMVYYQNPSVSSSRLESFEFSGDQLIFKNDDDFFMDEDVDYQPAKTGRDESAASAEGKAIQQQLQHQRQLARLQELQQHLRQQQGNTNSGDPGSLFNHPLQPHSTGSAITNSVLFPATQSNTAPSTYTQPSPTLIAASLSLATESSSSKLHTSATSMDSEYERSVTGPGPEGSPSRKTSQDGDDFGQVLQMTSAVGGPSSILPSLQQNVLPDLEGDSGEDPVIRRAEQNRAAQRAFRQRKQQYIKWLESKAEELDEVYRIMALVRTENQQLSKLVLELNSRLQATKDQKSYNGEISVKDKKSTIPKGASLSASSSAAAAAAVARDGHGILDLSISREVSMRLMNLTMTPGTSLSGNRNNGPVARPKYQPRSSTSSNDAKVVHAKGKSAFKQNIHQKRLEQNHLSLLQHQHSLLQLQLQQQQKHQRQQLQQQQQLRLQQHDHSFGVVSTPTTVSNVGGESILCSPLFLNTATTSPKSTTTSLGPPNASIDPLFALAPSPASIESPLRTLQSDSVHGSAGTPSPLFSAAVSKAVPLSTSLSFPMTSADMSMGPSSTVITMVATPTESTAAASQYQHALPPTLIPWQQQQQQQLQQELLSFPHPTLLALETDQLTIQQPSVFDRDVPSAQGLLTTGAGVMGGNTSSGGPGGGTVSGHHGRSSAPSHRQILHHPYANAGYSPVASQRPQQQQQLIFQPHHHQSMLYQPNLAHHDGLSHSIPSSLHPKVSQAPWMAEDDLTGSWKARRSSMPTLHLAPSTLQQQQQLQQQLKRQSQHPVQQ